MRITYIKLINYIGIFNGLGLHEIEIDFNKSKHKTIIIRGKNGSGKSTLFNALHPMYDSNENFIPNMEAHKYIHISHNDALYKIHFVHPVKSNGDRDTTKAFIKKFINNEIEDLNPNGNVSSFKDTLYNEFSLDPNYIALSSLGSESRGLADKKPAERKKFINSIIDTLVVYNDIYKTMSKRSSIFKAMINTLTSKIDNIGDEEKIKSSLVSIENRLNNLMNEKDDIVEQISSFKSTIKLIDPDGTIQETYNKIYNEITNYNIAYNKILDDIKKSYNTLKLNESIDYATVIDNYNKLKDEQNKLYTIIQVNESNINMFLKERESILSDIQIKNQKLNSLQSETDIEQLKNAIEMYEHDIADYKNIISKIGLIDMNISKEEYILALNTLYDIKTIIDTFKANSSLTAIEKAVYHVKNKTYPDIDQLDKDIEKLKEEIKEQELLYQKYSTLNEMSENLKLRPINCKIDNCPFIKDALHAFNQHPIENMENINNLLFEHNQRLQSMIQERKDMKEIIDCINYLNRIVRSIDINNKIFSKLKVGKDFCDKENILNMILNGYDFSVIDNIYSYIEYANIIDELKSKTNILIQLKNDLNLYNSKHDIIQDLVEELNKMKEKVNTLTNKISELKSNIDNDKLNQSKISVLIQNYNTLISNLNEKSNIETKKSELVSQFNAIKSSMMTIKQSLDNLDQYNSKLDIINKEISPLIEDRDKLKYGLSLLKQYQEELAIYNLKYEKIETIKKYSSPTKGIQTLFMELYMNKTLQMANDLLKLLFEGEYVLCPFEINENGFKIPCIGSGLRNDDISSTSCSQKAMMGLVINAALLCQASSKYNILKLDELDSGLDTANRLQFIYTLERISDILNLEQVFLISHNSEIDLSNCDIIQLKKVDGEDISNGNLIYEY